MNTLFTTSRAATYKKDEIIIRPHGVAGELFLIERGMVKVYAIEDSGVEKIEAVYGEEDVFPLARLIGKELSFLFYEALSDCDVRVIKVRKVQRIMKTDTAASAYLLDQTVKQFLMYKIRVDNLEYKYARDRLAFCLLSMGKRFGHEAGHVITMPRFGQDLLGITTNTSRESVSRELKRFEQLGYIEYAPLQIKILDQVALRSELVSAKTPLLFDIY